MYKFDIGGNEVKPSTAESIDFIPFNRTLVALQLTDEEAVVPEFVEGLKTIDDVFKNYAPRLEVKFPDGKADMLEFKSMADFSVQSMSEQSQTLRQSNGAYNDYAQIMKSLGENALLQRALSKPEDKDTIIAALRSLLEAMDPAEAAAPAVTPAKKEAAA